MPVYIYTVAPCDATLKEAKTKEAERKENTAHITLNR